MDNNLFLPFTLLAILALIILSGVFLKSFKKIERNSVHWPTQAFVALLGVALAAGGALVAVVSVIRLVL